MGQLGEYMKHFINVGIVTYFTYYLCHKIQQCFKSYLFKQITPKNDWNHWNAVADFRTCVEEVIKLMNRKPQAYSVVGMDCEMIQTPPGKYPVPGILQLANPDGYCAVFQLKVMEDDMQQENGGRLMSKFKPTPFRVLEQLLMDPAILKVGVAVMNDVLYLKEGYGLMTKGCLDIRYLAKQVGVEPKSLDFLAKKILGKDKMILTKNKFPWGNRFLSDRQYEYAITDARLGIEIFMELNRREINKRYSLLRRLFWDEKTYWKYTIRLWEKYIGKPFSLKEKDDMKIENDLEWFRNINFCSLKMLRNFMVFESTNSQTVRMCVVCLNFSQDSQVKLKAIVPEDYNTIKNYRIPEYVDLCKHCRQIHQQYSYQLRQELTLKCGAPFPEYEDNRLIRAKEIIKEIHVTNEPTVNLFNKLYVRKLLGIPKSNLATQTMEAIMTMDCRPGSAHGEYVRQYYERFHPAGVEGLSWTWYETFLAMKPVIQKFGPQNRQFNRY